MDRDGVLHALEAGEFDGISHDYQPYDGYGKKTHRISMSVSGGTIEATKTTRGKVLRWKREHPLRRQLDRLPGRQRRGRLHRAAAVLLLTGAPGPVLASRLGAAGSRPRACPRRRDSRLSAGHQV